MSRLNDDSDWSDSEDGIRDEVETSVLLGIPDGIVNREEDLNDAAVSRLGGHPAFLTSKEPQFASSQCKNCSYPMELLVQLWCPFEASTMDRALYVFGCGRSGCQRKPGSVRAFRGLRFNASYAAKLEKKKARLRERQAAEMKSKEEDKKQEAAKSNPFSVKSEAASKGLLGTTPTFTTGLGSQLFATAASDAKDDPEHSEDDENAPGPPPSDVDESSDTDESDSETDDSVLAAPASTPSTSSPWYNAPKYSPPLYLSTATEYLPPPPKANLWGKGSLEVDDESASFMGTSRKAEERRSQKEKENIAWNSAMEGYEDSMELDKVFECFARRTEYEGEQCIRYELGGTPLPYARDSVFDILFPSSSSISKGTVSSATQIESTHVAGRRKYSSQNPAITPCPRCGGRRVFECQLMPHLISVLQSSAPGEETTSVETFGPKKPPSSANGGAAVERRKEIEQLLKHGVGLRSMEWGSCLIFSCEKDCCQEDGRDAKEIWTEELVLVQWEES